MSTIYLGCSASQRQHSVPTQHGLSWAVIRHAAEMLHSFTLIRTLVKTTSDVGDVQHASVEAGNPSPDAGAEQLETASADETMKVSSGAPRNILVSAAQEVQHDVMWATLRARLTSVITRVLAHFPSLGGVSCQPPYISGGPCCEHRHTAVVMETPPTPHSPTM